MTTWTPVVISVDEMTTGVRSVRATVDLSRYRDGLLRKVAVPISRRVVASILVLAGMFAAGVAASRVEVPDQTPLVVEAAETPQPAASPGAARR